MKLGQFRVGALALLSTLGLGLVMLAGQTNEGVAVTVVGMLIYVFTPDH